MRLVHVITDLSVGGAQMQLCRLLEADPAAARRSEVVSLIDGGALEDRIRASGARLTTLGISQGGLSATALFALRRSIRTCDLVQSWMYHANLATTLAAAGLSSTPQIAWNIRHSLHDLTREKRLTRWVIRVGAWLSRRPAAIVYNARTSALQHEELGFAADRRLVIPNGFDCRHFRPQPDRRAWLLRLVGVDDDKDSPILFGMIARNHPMKDPGTLLSASAELARRGRDLHLVICGQGFDVGNRVLVETAATLGFGQRLHLLGPRDDVADVMAGLDVVVMPSAWGEGFPNVVGEAMAAGRPCVATDVGDAAWLVDRFGRIVPPGDPIAMANAMDGMIQLGEAGRATLGKEARRRILADFQLEDVARRYAELYNRILANHGAEPRLRASAERI